MLTEDPDGFTLTRPGTPPWMLVLLGGALTLFLGPLVFLVLIVALAQPSAIGLSVPLSVRLSRERLSVRSGWLGREQSWPRDEISSIELSDHALWIHAGRSHRVKWPLPQEDARRMFEGRLPFEDVRKEPKTRPPKPSLEQAMPLEQQPERTEDHDGLRLVVAQHIPWVALPAALGVMHALSSWSWFSPLQIAASVALFALSPELRPRTELQLTPDRLIVRGGWLQQTERVWALSDITALRAEWRDVLLEVDGQIERITRMPPEASRWLIARFEEQRREKVEALPEMPAELVELVAYERELRERR